MSMTELDVMRLRTEQSMEGVPGCGWCGDWSASDELFDCNTCSVKEHHACYACRTKKASPCKDWEECMECGCYVADPVQSYYCSDECAVEQDRIDSRTCGACLRTFDGPLPIIGYCSLSCWAMERGEL